MPPLRTCVLRSLNFLVFGAATLWAFPTFGGELDVEFQKVLPVLREYCTNCHSTEKQKGDLDLEVFTTVAEVKKHPKVWQAVVEQMETKEMPPKNKPQPTAEQRGLLLGWTGSLLSQVAREHAGDPGPVVLRRLSNREYTYTVRDLTGVESLDPAREFPVDGAAGEGFTNTGQALVMSPALLGKYLEAGKEIASHMVLLPEGIRFSPKVTRRDLTEEILARIRSFYGRYSADGKGSSVNLQGVKFETNAGGKLPVEKYLTILLQSRADLLAGTQLLGDVAKKEGVSAKYLELLWEGLQGEQSGGLLLDQLRGEWQHSSAQDAGRLAKEIAEWQGALWKFNSVGYAGIPTGPKGWMEPINPVVTRQEIRIKLPKFEPGKKVTIYLAAQTVGGKGSPAGAVVWERPRMAPKGKPEVLMCNVDSQKFDVEKLEGVGRESLCADETSLIELEAPAELASESEFVVTGLLSNGAGEECVQLQVVTEKPQIAPEGRPLRANAPVIIKEGSPRRKGLEEAFAAYRQLFPAALCYEKIVPVDEVVTLNLFYREDGELSRLMLTEAEQAELERLWAELRFVTQDALTQVDVLIQMTEFATQEGDATPFRKVRPAFEERANAFRQILIDAEPKQLDAVVRLATNAFRRPLRQGEEPELRTLYKRLREEELSHEDALRLVVAKIFVSPGFLYRAEEPVATLAQAPVSAWELANRLSYFLCSSAPDEQLLACAKDGSLLDSAVLQTQTSRLLKGPGMRRLGLEFGAQWLHLRDLGEMEEKSERHFPTFAALRGDLLEETVQTFSDLFQKDRSILSLIDSDATFVNESLATHYGIPDVKGPEMRRVEGVRKFSRGGLLAQGAVLSKQAGASRTSPILRGNFIVETLLGEKIPRPPKDVPPFPEDTGAENLTVRQITERHSADARCAGCHERMDAFGFALESFDGIGRFREKDEGGHQVEVDSKLADGTAMNGVDGLRAYLTGPRRDAFVRQFSRKLLGFALGRAVQLSDEPLLDEIKSALEAHDFRVSIAVDQIVQSRQFREIRGRDVPRDEIAAR